MARSEFERPVGKLARFFLVGSVPMVMAALLGIAWSGKHSSDTPKWLLAAAAGAASLVGAGSYQFLYRIRRDIHEVGGEIKYYGGKVAAQEAHEVENKKQQYLNIPTIAFHFADKDQIRSYYNDHFKEPTVEKIVAEIASELTGDVSAKLPKVLEAKAGGKNLSKWISDIRLPDISLSEMFRRWQRETIKNDQVTLGLELVDIDLSDLSAFDKTIADIADRFRLTIPPEEVESKRSELRRKAAESTLVRLEKASGWVLVEGRFLIADLSEGFYKCVYKHPVNEYLGTGDTQVTLTVSLRKESLEPSVAGNYAQSVDKLIPLKVYGKVWSPVSRSSGSQELQITPLAVY